MLASNRFRAGNRHHCVKIPIPRFTDLIASCLFERRHLGAIDKPGPSNRAAPNVKSPKIS
jgi:putative transposase